MYLYETSAVVKHKHSYTARSPCTILVSIMGDGEIRQIHLNLQHLHKVAFFHALLQTDAINKISQNMTLKETNTIKLPLPNK